MKMYDKIICFLNLIGICRYCRKEIQSMKKSIIVGIIFLIMIIIVGILFSYSYTHLNGLNSVEFQSIG